ncbi:MAG: EamA family transporter, partial [bacterium]|nr:EamA family transporter [bacterium]
MAVFAALFSAFSWGMASLLFGRILRHPEAHLRPSAGAINLFKGLLAALVFGVLWIAFGGSAPARPSLPLLLLSGFLGFALGDTLYIAALPRCGVQIAAMIGTLIVPLAALLAWLWLGQELSLTTLGAMAVVLAGVVMVVLDAPRGRFSHDPRVRRTGILLGLATALTQAVALVSGHKALAATDVIPGTVVRLLAGSVGIFVLSFVFGLVARGRTSAREVSELVRPMRDKRLARGLFVAAFFGSVLGLVPFHYALRELPSGVGAVLFTTTPLFTLPLGFLFGERHGWRAAVGTLVGFLGVIGVVVSLPGEKPPAPPELEVVGLHQAGGARFPNLARAESGDMALTWLAPEGDAWRLWSRTRQGSWNDPVTVASGEGWFVNWADFPAVAFDGERAVATWLEKSGEHTYAYGVRFARSSDAGKSWTDAGWLHDDRSETEHGFVSLASLDGGDTFATWLDGRATPDGAMTLRARVVGAELGAEMLLDERVCDCCQTAAVTLADGAVVVAWRDRSDTEVRDIAVTRGDPRVTGSFAKPRVVHADGWEIAGCPVNGPALDALGETVALAWFTGANEEPSAKVAFSHDGGRTFGAPVEFAGEAGYGRVDVALLDESRALVTWLESDGEKGAWRARTVDGAELGAVVTIAAADPERASGFLRLARDGGKVLAAWTDVESGELAFV